MLKILGLGAALIIIIAAVSVGTYAYFNDVQSSTGNAITAGTLDIGLANSASGAPLGDATGTWAVTNMKPADTDDATLFVYNGGTLPVGSITMAFTYTLTGSMPVTVHGTHTTALDTQLTATTVKWDGVTQDGSGGTLALEGKTLSAIAGMGTLTMPLSSDMATSTYKGLEILWTLPTTADNGCQGVTANITDTVTAEQNHTGTAYP